MCNLPAIEMSWPTPSEICGWPSCLQKLRRVVPPWRATGPTDFDGRTKNPSSLRCTSTEVVRHRCTAWRTRLRRWTRPAAVCWANRSRKNFEVVSRVIGRAFFSEQSPSSRRTPKILHLRPPSGHCRRHLGLVREAVVAKQSPCGGIISGREQSETPRVTTGNKSKCQGEKNSVRIYPSWLVCKLLTPRAVSSAKSAKIMCPFCGSRRCSLLTTVAKPDMMYERE